MPANTRPEVKWTNEQLDRIDDMFFRLRAEVECVRTCLQYLIHYDRPGEGIYGDELPGARYVLKSAMREARATVDEWWEQMRRSASSEAEGAPDA